MNKYKFIGWFQFKETWRPYTPHVSTRDKNWLELFRLGFKNWNDSAYCKNYYKLEDAYPWYKKQIPDILTRINESKRNIKGRSFE